jgi:hypothetical protein
MPKTLNKANARTNITRSTKKHELKLEALGIDISLKVNLVRIPTIGKYRKLPYITNH